MNPKILLAFAGGLIVASGITYIAMKRSAPVAVEAARSNIPASAPAASANPPSAEPETAAPESKPVPEAAAASESAKPSPAVNRTPRLARSRPAAGTTVAVNTPPAAPVPPAPETPPVQTPVPETPPAQTPPPAPDQVRVEPPAPQPHTVTIPSGTLINVRMGETLSTERNQSGDQFTATLDQPLVVDGFVLAERGARAQGRVVELDRSGKVRGVARMAVELTQLHTADGQSIRLNTAAFTSQADTTRNKDAAKVGIGAVLGAAIGAMAGGGKGAGIGAGVGGAAGAGDVLMTRGQAAEIRVETRVSFRLSEAVTVTEKLH